MSEQPKDSSVTPEGDHIETHTMWLDFGDEGECAISLDFTRYFAALGRFRDGR